MSVGASNRARSRLAGIEGVRALAALAVLGYHVWLYSTPRGAPTSLGYLGDTIGSNLFVGVTLFFVLSGFLLYRPYAASVIRGRPAPAWRRYLSNRALRILPAYWVVLLVVALLLKPVLAAHPTQLAANWFFLQNYVPGYMPVYNGGVGIVPAWSLANEVVFYLLLPLLGAWALTLRRRGGPHPVAAALAPAVLLLAVGLVSTLAVASVPDGFHRVWRAGFLPHAGWFGVGMVLAVARVLWEDGRFVTHRRWPLIAVLASAALALPALALYHRLTIDQLEYEFVLALCCGLLLSIVALPRERSWTVAALSSRPLTAIGLASYSVFLWHDPLLRALRDAGMTRGGGAGAFVFNLLLVGSVTGVASTATYLLVEKTALARKRPWQVGEPARAERRITVRERLEACATRVAGERRSDVEIAAPPELALRMDGQVFDRIAEELLANALAYGSPPIQMTASSDDDHIVLAVRDHGRGVAPDFVPRLFELFTRSEASRRQRKTGQGLGLATIRRQAEENGGHVSYAGDASGALFLLELPPTLALPAATPSPRKTGERLTPKLPVATHAQRVLRAGSWRPRLAHAVAALAAVALVAVVPAVAAPQPLPASIAALGDSLTRGWGAAGAAADDPAASWSTGTDATVDSHYARLLRRTAAIDANSFNDAASGTKMAATYAQAGVAVAQGADYVTILSGTNDVCTATAAQMTAAADFAVQLRATLSRLVQGLPDAQILVVSIPNRYALWQSFHTTPAAVQAWASSAVCPSLLGGSATDADRQAVAQRIVDLNAAATSVCAEFSACANDGGAAYSLDLAAGDLAFDWFHLSLSGQARLAAATWAAGPFAVPPPPLDAFTAAFNSGTATLTWTLPDDVARVVILQKQGSPPAGPGDGTTVYDASGAEGSHVVTGLTAAATYYYAAWTYDLDNIAGEVVQAAVGPPANTTPPSLTGTALDGQTLTASPGIWTGYPDPTYTYQWQWSTDESTGWTNIAAATAATYTLTSGDVDHYLRVQVIATNPSANSTVATAKTAKVAAAAAQNTVAPTVSGSAVVGSTLLAPGPGTWTGTAPITYAYQWQSSADGSTGWTDIAGATGTSYTLVAAAVGNYLRLQVTATNAAGPSSANSTAIGPIAASSSGGSSSGGGGGGGGGGSGGGGSSGGGGAGAADLRLEGSVEPQQAAVGDTVTWRLTVNDYNTGPAVGVWLDVQLSDNVSITSTYADRGSGCVAVAPDKLHCDLDWLADTAQFGHVIVTTRVTGAGDLVVNANTGYSHADPVPTDNALTLTMSRATPPAATPPVTPVAPAAPKAAITILKASAAPNGTVTVQVTISGWTVNTKQVKNANAASGYWLIYVDGKRNAISRRPGSGVTGKLAPGKHSLRVELIRENGTLVTPRALSKTIVVNVPKRAATPRPRSRA